MATVSPAATYSLPSGAAASTPADWPDTPPMAGTGTDATWASVRLS